MHIHLTRREELQMVKDIAAAIAEFGLSRVSGGLCRLIQESIRLEARRCDAEELALGESESAGCRICPRGGYGRNGKARI